MSRNFWDSYDKDIQASNVSTKLELSGIQLVWLHVNIFFPCFNDMSFSFILCEAAELDRSELSLI